MKTVGQSLKDKRLRAHLSVKELSERSGVPDSTIRRYETSICSRQLENLMALADALGLTLDEIVGHVPVEKGARR